MNRFSKALVNETKKHLLFRHKYQLITTDDINELLIMAIDEEQYEICIAIQEVLKEISRKSMKTRIKEYIDRIQKLII